VLARESYNFKLLQNNYDTTVLLSSPDVGRGYQALFDGDKALDKIYGQSKEIRIAIISITLSGDSVSKKAIVRFTKTAFDPQAGIAEMPQPYVATFAYDYKQRLTGPEKDLILNPMGFTVTGYRTDAEYTPPAAAQPVAVQPIMTEAVQ
jgi:type IV secretion system protein VirB8